jgi:hypothetical protein
MGVVFSDSALLHIRMARQDVPPSGLLLRPAFEILRRHPFHNCRPMSLALLDAMGQPNVITLRVIRTARPGLPSHVLSAISTRELHSSASLACFLSYLRWPALSARILSIPAMSRSI